jgi:hypothetical protein
MAHTTAERGTEVRMLSAVPTFLAEDVAETTRWYVGLPKARPLGAPS